MRLKVVEEVKVPTTITGSTSNLFCHMANQRLQESTSAQDTPWSRDARQDSRRQNNNFSLRQDRREFVPSNIGAIHPDALPVTHDRVFRPKLVAHLYKLRGKAFLQRFYTDQHRVFNDGMRTIRGWFNRGFDSNTIKEFASVNLRKDRDEALSIRSFIESNIGNLGVLHFETGPLHWRVDDVYAKVLEWRHYKRKDLSILKTRLHTGSNGLQALVAGGNQEAYIPRALSLTAPQRSYANIFQDAKRRRCYAAPKICLKCRKEGVDWHVLLYGSSDDIPLQVIAWRYNMQRSMSEEYLETPSLDGNITLFGVGTYQTSKSYQHYQTWEVELTHIMDSVSSPIYIPGGGGKMSYDCEVGETITIASIYARREECQKMRDEKETQNVNAVDVLEMEGCVEKDYLKMGSKTFSQFMSEAIDISNVSQCNYTNTRMESAYSQCCERESGEIMDGYGRRSTQDVMLTSLSNSSRDMERMPCELLSTRAFDEEETVLERGFEYPSARKLQSAIPTNANEASTISNTSIRQDSFSSSRVSPPNCNNRELNMEHLQDNLSSPLFGSEVPIPRASEEETISEEGFALSLTKRSYYTTSEKDNGGATNSNEGNRQEKMLVEFDFLNATCPSFSNVSSEEALLDRNGGPDKQLKHSTSVPDQGLWNNDSHFASDFNDPIIEQEPTLAINQGPIRKGKKRIDKKFASLNSLMEVQVNKKKKQDHVLGLVKRKVLSEMQNGEEILKISESHADIVQLPSVSRSLRLVKKPSRYNDVSNNKENMARKSKKSTSVRRVGLTNGLHREAVENIDIEVKERLAMEAMEIHDVDTMYGQLWEAIRPLKAQNLTTFADCSNKSDQLHLLHCYVGWIVESGMTTHKS